MKSSSGCLGSRGGLRPPVVLERACSQGSRLGPPGAGRYGDLRRPEGYRAGGFGRGGLTGKRLFCAEAQSARLGFHRPMPNSLDRLTRVHTNLIPVELPKSSAIFCPVRNASRCIWLRLTSSRSTRFIKLARSPAATEQRSSQISWVFEPPVLEEP